MSSRRVEHGQQQLDTALPHLHVRLPYSGERGAADRLGVVQGVIAHDFHSRDIAIDGQELLQHAVALKQRIEWGWKAFIEGKLDTYFSQVREAEQAVDTAIKGYNEQVYLLTKTLIDNMLAAVGIVVVSFLAAVFKDPFNPHVFQVGTTLYALYLLVFSMLFGLVSTWQRYEDSQRAFETRKASLSQRLSVDEVERTVGASVQERETWFKKWFRPYRRERAIAPRFLYHIATKAFTL